MQGFTPSVGANQGGSSDEGVHVVIRERGHGSPTRMPHGRGQSLVEFALVVPILMLLVGGIIQFGIIFWAQNTLTQIVRDTGRFAATQQCNATTLIVSTANAIAKQSSLIGYTTNLWTDSTTPVVNGVTVAWQIPVNEDCPPESNTQTSFVTISITHKVPIFFPWIPGNGTLSSSTQFRMEPTDQP